MFVCFDKALPLLNIVVIKPDKNGNPFRAKSRIVVLVILKTVIIQYLNKSLQC